MKVKDVMRWTVYSCGPGTNLAEAAKVMWDRDCGALPVVNGEGKVIGMITDRDICISLATKNRLASEVAVWESISGEVYTCSPDDDIQDALKTMEVKRVRRLPVINANGELQGVLSMNDIVLKAEGAKGWKTSGLSYDDVIRTLKAVCVHRELVKA